LNQTSPKLPSIDIKNQAKMGLGVLEDTHLEHVPGTALLTDVVDLGDPEHHHHGTLDTSLLKHDKGRDSDVLLVPQPSNSPNDPLNWPLWKKDLMLFLICIDTAVFGAWVSGDLDF
jgi:hypothetical protein